MTLYWIFTFIFLAVFLWSCHRALTNLTDHHGAQVGPAILAVTAFLAWFWLTVGVVVAHYFRPNK